MNRFSYDILQDESIVEELVKSDETLHEIYYTHTHKNLLPTSQTQMNQYTALVTVILSYMTPAKRVRSILKKLCAILECNIFLPKDTMTIDEEEWYSVIGVQTWSYPILKAAEEWCHHRTDYALNYEWWDMYNLQNAKDTQAIFGLTQLMVDTVSTILLTDLNACPLMEDSIFGRIVEIYGIDNPTRKTLEEITQLWEPYRAIVCWWLWRCIDI